MGNLSNDMTHVCFVKSPIQGGMKNMGESLYAKMRANERFNIALNATYSIKRHDTQHQECWITNLSSSGAKVRFPHAVSLRNGAAVLMEISIPNTVMRIATEAKIMWTKQRYNRLIGGIKFTDILIEGMLQQFVKKVPQLSDYTELIAQTPPLPCATGVHGEFPRRDFNTLDKTVVPANGQPSLLLTSPAPPAYNPTHGTTITHRHTQYTSPHSPARE